MNSDGAMPNEDEKREKRERGREGRSIASISLFLSLPSADLPTSHRIASHLQRDKKALSIPPRPLLLSFFLRVVLFCSAFG